MKRAPTRSPLFTPVALALVSLFALACEGEGVSTPDAAPPISATTPQTGNVDRHGDTTPSAFRSCDDFAKDGSAWLPDDQLDALLGRFTGASCAGELSCEVGQPQSCRPGFNAYSTHAIGCRCQGGKFSCRDYRAEARACSALRSDGGAG